MVTKNIKNQINNMNGIHSMCLRLQDRKSKFILATTKETNILHTTQTRFSSIFVLAQGTKSEKRVSSTGWRQSIDFILLALYFSLFPSIQKKRTNEYLQH